MNGTTLPGLAYLVAKLEDVIEDIVPEPATYLSSRAKYAEVVLLEAMKPFCFIIRCVLEDAREALLKN